jgi:phospholipid/cholesterol/gamma-HCH transport system substrate-binding protein
MGRLIDELEAAPQMLVVGRGARQPGPGENGFEAPVASQHQ